MQLYNIHKNKIEDVQMVRIGDVSKPIRKIEDDAELNNAGYFKVERPALTNEATKKRASSGSIVYDKDDQGNDLATGKYVIGEVDKSLDELKAEKKQALKQNYEAEKLKTYKMLANREVYLIINDKIKTNIRELKDLMEAKFSNPNSSANTSNFVFDAFRHNKPDANSPTGFVLESITVNADEVYEILDSYGSKELELKTINETKDTLIDNASNQTELEEIDITFN